MYKQFIKDNSGHAHHRAIKQFYKHLITDALTLSNGNKSKAAQMLGITRMRLRMWMQAAGLEQ